MFCQPNFVLDEGVAEQDVTIVRDCAVGEVFRGSQGVVLRPA